MTSLKVLTEQMLPAIEDEMRHVLQATEKNGDPFYGMLHYHMGWVNKQFKLEQIKSGKRIRPLLCLLTCAAADGQWQQAIPAASALEILHNFSLIHDDIEDASPTRRGRETIWTIWGIEQGINIGDAMFALSFLAMTRLTEREVSAAVTVDALRRFGETCVTLTHGQYYDMWFETQEIISVEEYINMITGKTAVLLSLASELGGRIAGVDEDTWNHYAQFGLKSGLAFQVIDDILGIWGDEGRIGKSAATDIMTKKKTLPVLYGLENDQALRDMYLTTEEPDASFVKFALDRLNQMGALDYAKEKAAHYSKSALHHLEEAQPSGEAGEALFELADMLLDRDF